MRNYYKQTQVNGFLTGLKKVSNEKCYQTLREQLKLMAEKCDIDPNDFEFLFGKTLENNDQQITKIFRDLIITAKLKWSEDLKEHNEKKEESREQKERMYAARLRLQQQFFANKFKSFD